MTKISKNFTKFSETKFVDSYNHCGGDCGCGGESCDTLSANQSDFNAQDSAESYARFTADMKETHTILVPTMLPIHFRFMVNIMRDYGYHTCYGRYELIMVAISIVLALILNRLTKLIDHLTK